MRYLLRLSLAFVVIAFVAAPNPAAAQSSAPLKFSIFFNYQDVAVTPEASMVAQQIAAAVQARLANGQKSQITVDGLVDGAALTPDEIKLSLQRAQNVAVDLVRFGVPREIITINEGAHPNENGPKNPVSRRVEIRIF